MGQAISSPTPALVSIKKEMGEPVAIAVLVEIIGDAVDFFSVGKTMNDKQLGETARLLLQEFYYLKIADLKLFFDRLKTGYYGQLYDRIDGNVIMLHLRNYCTERISTAEEISLLAHRQTQPATEETYIIATGAHYVAHNATDGYFEVTQRELATPFTLAQAIKIKHWLVTGPLSHQPETVRIKKPHTQIGLIDWMQQNTPQLVPKNIAYQRQATQTAQRFKHIDGDNALSAYEKYSAKVKLIGIVPMGEEEWEKYNREVLLARGESG